VDRDLEDLLRDAVTELADEGRAVNLSRPALRRARVLRIRRRVAAGVSALVLIAGLVAVTAAGTAPPGPDRPTTADGPPPTSAGPGLPTGPTGPTGSPSHGADGKANRPTLLPGGWAVRGAPTGGGVALFDDRTGRYREIAVPGGVVAPAGRYVVSFRGGQAVRIHDAYTGQDVRNNLPGTGDIAPAWAGDGTRFAYVSGGRVVIAAVATGQASGNPPVGCGGGGGGILSCDLRWSNNDQEIRIYVAGGVRVLDVATATVSAGGHSARQDDTDPCPGHRGYQIPVSSLTPEELRNMDNSQDVWGCVTAQGFQLRSASDLPSTVTDLDGAAPGPDRVTEPPRYTLFRYAG
jgi:hypothetical protein